MNLCECGCGAEAKKRFIRGHQFKKKLPTTVIYSLDGHAPQFDDKNYGIIAIKTPSAIADGPPEYPHPIDRTKWRLAEDRPGTLATAPWIRTQCHSCLLPMWTKDPLSTWENGGICEECGYILREDAGNQKISMGKARTPYDPFI